MALAETFPPGNGTTTLGEGLDETRQPLDEARHLPAYIYTSPELFEMEKQKIFMKDWLAVARAEEVERPGDYMTFTIVGEPIIVARNYDGELNAFYNVCAHRGVEVAAGEGNLKHFQCPYHAWTYDLSGKLMGAAYMDDVKGFDAATCRLKPLRLGVWEGWVFVNFDEDAAPLADFVAEFAEEFGVFQQGRCRLLPGKLDTVLNCNWKLVNENFVDLYHIQTLHADTLPDWPDARDYPYKQIRNGGYSAFFDANLGSADTGPPFGALPWLEDWLRERGPGFYGAGFLSPNQSIFIASDRISQILVQDRPMTTSLQRAMTSRGFAPGRMSSSELLVYNYVNHYLESLFGAP
jgi:choline monooxygenase